MPEIGQTISHYQIIEKLGQGGMGVVYKARDLHLDRFVAIKVLPPERVAYPERKRRFILEAKAASALNHPGIITIHDIDQAEGTDFIAMEYVPGKTLDDIIPRKGMRLSLALKHAIQIADALARAHGTGIIHRDLKPSNVMVDEHGLVKVLDFGLAKLSEAEGPEAETVSAGTAAGEIVGTAAYMSPEQAEGKPIDARSDIFSFGSMFYEMLTGERAFRGETPASTIAAILREEPKPVSQVTAGLPRELERIVKRCLRKDPDHRFQHMDDLKVALEELKEESDSGALSAGSQTRATRRRRTWLLAGAAVLLPLVAVLAWVLIPTIRRSEPHITLVPLTTFPGDELYPTFNRDGSQVAFAWRGEQEDNSDIFVKLVGETNALRLTTDPAPELWPAWSPDGKRIAFQRDRPDAPGIWMVSPLGGTEQPLADLQAIGQMSWSPDGQWLAVARGISLENIGEMRGIFLVPVNGGEPRRLTDPKQPLFDIHPCFSPDGRQLAYASCSSRWSCDLFVQPLDSGYTPREDPHRVTNQGVNISGLASSRDGRSLVYSGSLSWGMTRRLWRVGVSGEQMPELLESAGFQAAYPSIAPAGNRMAFSKSIVGYDIWRYRLGGVPEPLLRSSLQDYTAQFSPDGSRIAFSSGRSGDVIEIWIATADGTRAVQLTTGPGRGQGTPRWSPDGLLIAFDSQDKDGLSHIYVIDANGGQPRQVTSGTSSDHMPSWSIDGKWIYFFSDQTGRNEIWRLPTDGGEAQQITENGGDAAFESNDGKTLFYTKDLSSPLFARSLDAGPERQVLAHVSMRAFSVFEDGIYYIGRRGDDKQYPIQFYEFATGTSRPVIKVEGPLQQGLSVSPDRKIILFSKSATAGSDLMLVENFR